jgi:hypothetical protein
MAEEWHCDASDLHHRREQTRRSQCARDEREADQCHVKQKPRDAVHHAREEVRPIPSSGHHNAQSAPPQIPFSTLGDFEDELLASPAATQSGMERRLCLKR